MLGNMCRKNEPFILSRSGFRITFKPLPTFLSKRISVVLVAVVWDTRFLRHFRSPNGSNEIESGWWSIDPYMYRTCIHIYVVSVLCIVRVSTIRLSRTWSCLSLRDSAWKLAAPWRYELVGSRGPDNVILESNQRPFGLFSLPGNPFS